MLWLASLNYPSLKISFLYCKQSSTVSKLRNLELSQHIYFIATWIRADLVSFELQSSIYSFGGFNCGIANTIFLNCF
jgi:hypothetical protein